MTATKAGFTLDTLPIIRDQAGVQVDGAPGQPSPKQTALAKWLGVWRKLLDQSARQTVFD